ncbi:MAG: hypothetical protein AB7L90_19165 [Hyphomicrobiaceae bacterium]
MTESIESESQDIQSEVCDVYQIVAELDEKLDRLLAAVAQIAAARHVDAAECVDAVQGRPCQCTCHE